MIAAIRDKMAEPIASGGVNVLTKWYLNDGFIYGATRKECQHRLDTVIEFITSLGIDMK